MKCQTKYLSVSETARLLAISERRVRQMIDAGKLPGCKKDSNSWLVPSTADSRLSGILTADELTQAADLTDTPIPKRDKALRLLGKITEFEKFSAKFVRQGKTRVEAAEVFATQNDMSVRTLYNYIERYRLDGILGLVDRRGGKYKRERISPGAMDRFKQLYLDQRQPSLKTCWEIIRYENDKKQHNWLIPSLRTMHNIVKDEIPVPTQILLREGQAAYEAKCAPYIQTDYASIEPGQIWVGDHHQFNCWILDSRGRWQRPWLTAWLDIRSRKLVGWDINFNPNQTTILRAFKMAAEQFGPPEGVKIDNGRDYDSQLFTGTTKKKRKRIKLQYDTELLGGIYNLLGISVNFAIPYHPQSKSIERFFDTMDMQFCKGLATYCGKDSARKPEKLNEFLSSEKFRLKNGINLGTFKKLFSKYVDVYNSTAHFGSGMSGHSPDQVFAKRDSRRVLRDGVLDLVCRVWSEPLKVGKNGVRFKNLYFGQFDSNLLSRFGEMVRLSYDPDDLGEVHIYDLNFKYICTTTQNQLVKYGAVGEDHLRQAMREKARAMKQIRSARGAKSAAISDIAGLAIEAKAAETLEAEQPDDARLKPVGTKLDLEIGKHQPAREKLRLAAGAENQTLGLIPKKLKSREKPKKLGLFNV